MRKVRPIVELSHPQKVRLLYKTILKLHRGLPTELKHIGDQYAKEEFRRHKNVDMKFINTFMQEWTNYALRLTGQIGVKGVHISKPIGIQLRESDLDNFSGEQIYQLHELYKGASHQYEHTGEG